MAKKSREIVNRIMAHLEQFKKQQTYDEDKFDLDITTEEISDYQELVVVKVTEKKRGDE